MTTNIETYNKLTAINADILCNLKSQHKLKEAIQALGGHHKSTKTVLQILHDQERDYVKQVEKRKALETQYSQGG